MGRGLRIKEKVVGPGGQAGGGTLAVLCLHTQKQDRGLRPALRRSSEYNRAGASWKSGARTEGGRWRLDAAGRSWAEGIGFPPRVLSGDRPRGPPAPPRRVFRGPGRCVGEQPARCAEPQPSVRAWSRAPFLLQPAAAMAAAAASRSLLVLLQVLGLALAQIVSPGPLSRRGLGSGVWGPGPRAQAGV